MKKIITLLITLAITSYSFGQYDIDDTQTFTFEDISTTGTQISLTDDGVANITAPWTLYLGQNASTDLRIGNNGAILFGTTTGNVASSNAALTTATPMIAPFWDDFDTELGGVYYKTITEYLGGILLYSKFVIQWDRVHYNGSSNTDIARFQVVFYKSPTNSEEANRSIRFVYADVDMDGTAWDNGASATIGVATADEVSQYSFNTASLAGVNTIIFSVPTTNIADANFENYLETHNFEGYPRSIGDDDTMGDGIANNNKVFTNRINTVTNLDISNLNITNLTGIEDFEALENIDFSDNQVAAVWDFSTTPNLTHFTADNNQLTGTLDFTNVPQVTRLSFNNNDIVALITANNNNLYALDCSYNENFTTLSLLGKTLLHTLNISHTYIEQIDDTTDDSSDDLNFIDCVSLQELTAVDIAFSADVIDVNRQLNLITMDVSNNITIDKIILPSAQSSLKYFTMENIDGGGYRTKIINIPASTMLESFIISGKDPYEHSILGGDIEITWGLLDFSNCTNLQLVWISNTEVKTIDLRGATANIVPGGFNVKNNRFLHCIYVDDVATAESNWDNYKDYGTSFVADETACSNRLVYVPDDDFENYLETHNYLGDVVPIGDSSSVGNGVADDNYISAQKAESQIYLYLTLTGLNVTDLTGIEGFTALERLSINSDYGITSINLTNLWLNYLKIYNNNNLTSVNISQLERLEDLRVTGNNSLTSLDLTQNEALTVLHCENSQFSTLDLTHNGALENLHCENGQFNTLNLTQNSALYNLNCENNILSSLDLTQNSALEYLYCQNNVLNNLDLTQNGALKYLHCENNSINTLNLPQNGVLKDLYCQNNSLSALDLTQNVDLLELDCSNNQIQNLNITQNIDLGGYSWSSTGFLNCSNNQLTALDTSQNINLHRLDCSHNQIASLDLDTNPILRIDARYNALTSLHIQNGENDNLSGTYTDSEGNNISRFRVQGNPNLSCIFVDNATDATNGVNDYVAWQKDTTAGYVETTSQCDALAVADSTIVGLELYPNPAKDVLQIQAINTIDTIAIYDMLGQVVLRQNPMQANLAIDLTALSSGNYIVKIQSENQVGTYKLVKE